MGNIRVFHAIGFLRGLYFYLPIFTLYLVNQEISLANVIFAQTFYSLLKFVGEVPTGLFADKYGQRISIIIGYFLEALGFVALLVSPTTFGLYACYAIGGFSAAFLSGSEEALLFESAKKAKAHYAKAYATFMSNATLGMVVSTLTCGVLVQWLGDVVYEPLIWATALMLLVCMFLASTLSDFKTRIKEGSKGAGMFHVLSKSIKLMRSNDTLFNLTVVGVLTLSGEYYLYNAYQPVFQSLSVPPFMFGAALSAGLVLNAIVTRYVYVLERYFTLDKIILLVSLVLAVGYVTLGLTGSATVAVLAFIGFLGALEIQGPIVSDYVNERVTSDIRSTVLSGISFTTRVMTMVLRIGLALIVAQWGMEASLVGQGLYLAVGGMMGYWILVRCGCIHRISKHNGKLV